MPGDRGVGHFSTEGAHLSSLQPSALDGLIHRKGRRGTGHIGHYCSSPSIKAGTHRLVVPTRLQIPVVFSGCGRFLPRLLTRPDGPCQKAKTPRDALRSWLLARAAARRLKVTKDSLTAVQDRTTPTRGSVTFIAQMPLWTDATLPQSHNVSRHLKTGTDFTPIRVESVPVLGSIRVFPALPAGVCVVVFVPVILRRWVNLQPS